MRGYLLAMNRKQEHEPNISVFWLHVVCDEEIAFCVSRIAGMAQDDTLAFGQPMPNDLVKQRGGFPRKHRSHEKLEVSGRFGGVHLFWRFIGRDIWI